MLSLERRVEGNPTGHTLLFIQGWPDDMTLWNAQVEVLAPEYRCVRVNLPNLGGSERVRAGYRTDEILDALEHSLVEFSADGPLTLVVHDWGAYWGYMIHNRNPARVVRLVGLDVAPHIRPTPGLLLGTVLYQSWLASAFLIGGPIGDGMTRALAAAMGAPRPTRELDSTMNYPYRNVFEDLASGRVFRYTAKYWPKMPILFAYGAKSPLYFHSDNWYRHVRAQDDGAVVPLDTGHWLMKKRQFTEVLADWLHRTRYVESERGVAA